MPDVPLEPDVAPPSPSPMEPRVAVLEELARTTGAALERMDRRLDTMTAEHRAGLDGLRSEYRADFRWLPGTMLAGFGTLLGLLGGLIGVSLHGLH